MISHSIKNIYKNFALLLLACLLCFGAAEAQTTAFTYQGKLTDSNQPQPTNGTYDVQFRLFDSPGAGTQQGATVTNGGVQVSGGVFTVSLDFGQAVFTLGSDVYLEISLRPAGSTGGYTSLAPRQRITSAPFAVQSLNAATATTAVNATTATNATSATNATNAAQLGGIAAAQYVVTGDARLSDSRVPTAGSPNYVQNASVQQANSNFNIAGNGTAAGTLSGFAVNAIQQYTIGSNRVLSIAGTNNLFAGVGAGVTNTFGSNNLFAGFGAGQGNTIGGSNAFVGTNAGLNNTSGTDNSFVGAFAGQTNTTGASNSFVGSGSGLSNTTGGSNSFVGKGAGQNNTTGGLNSFVGASAGFSNTTGGSNSFFGTSTGQNNTTGTQNSFFGRQSGFANTTGINNAFFGFGSGVANTTAVQNSFFGASSGAANTTGSFNAFFGYLAGNANTTGFNNAFFGQGAGNNNTIGQDNTFLGNFAGHNNTNSENTFIGSGAGLNNTTGKDNVFLGFNAGITATGNVDSTFVGSLAGFSNTTGILNSFVGGEAGRLNTIGSNNSFFGVSAGQGNTVGNHITTLGAFAGVSNDGLVYATAIGADSTVFENNSIALGRSNGSDTVNIYGHLELDLLRTGGTTPLCRNSSNEISLCSSSLRYKTNIGSFNPGLNLVSRLHPITFNWKDGGMADLGFGAEDVAKVEPLLVTHNAKGEIEGVKYDRISAVLVNAIKEQQAQISNLKKQIDALNKIVLRSRHHTRGRR